MMSTRHISLLVGGAVVLALAPAVAAAEPCKAVEQRALKVMRSLDAAGQAAVTLAAQCMFRGPDAKAVAKLGALARKTLAGLDHQAPPDPACIKGGNFDKAIGTLGNAMGQRVGLAWALCSAEAQATAKSLAAKQVPEADIEAELGKMGTAWLTGLLQ